MKTKYSAWQRFVVRVFGRAEIGTRIETGWREPMKLYLSKCPDHGYFEDTLHGFGRYMNCPECLKGRK